ncbi:hypothetical protein NC796_19495 [Aliifodinibius sp. S!AR15-10]|nr:hypothetical protein [Aliifodinibius sp. S!AR15-10]MDR8393348.1 hypothetical protein [Aliifodinibius sp. S!AR15-10]
MKWPTSGRRINATKCRSLFHRQFGGKEAASQRIAVIGCITYLNTVGTSGQAFRDTQGQRLWLVGADLLRFGLGIIGLADKVDALLFQGTVELQVASKSPALAIEAFSPLVTSKIYLRNFLFL